MALSDFGIKNPVFPVMLCSAMVVFGILGVKDLGIAQFPEVDFPVVSIQTTREAASPDIIDGDVTDVIEDAVSSVEGIESIKSASVQGTSVVTVYFRLHRDIDVAVRDVQNAVSAAMNRLPTDIDPPTITKVNMNKFPVMWLSVHGAKPLSEINRLVDDQLKQAVETIPGCGGLMFGGLRQRNMRIWLDAKKMQAFNLDVRDVASALRRENVEKPGGYLASEQIEITVRTLGEARTVEDFANIVIADRGDRLVRLSDVAIIEDGLSDKRTMARFNGDANVGIGLMRAQGANVVALCDEVKRRLPALRELLPDDNVQLDISVDYSTFIKQDVDELKFALSLGIGLTAIVAFLFLGSLGPTINICLSIPTSLAGTFFVMKVMGFTINFMTLLALSLSVGVVVDDAILVLENIFRRCEHGEPPYQAALAGAREISFAAIAATLSICAIFLPVAFLEGSISRYFMEFGITVSAAVMLSLVTSLTLTPMLCAFFLKIRKSPRPLPPAFRGPIGPVLTGISWTYWFFDRWLIEPVLVRTVNFAMHWLSALYGWFVAWALRLRWLVVLASIGLIALAQVFLSGASLPPLAQKLFGVDKITPIGRELIPSEDQSRFVVRVVCPVGSSVEHVDMLLGQCEQVLRATPEVRSFFAAISTQPGQPMNEGILFCRLVDIDEREKTQNQVLNDLRIKLSVIPGMSPLVMDLSTQGFTAQRSFPVDFIIVGPDWDKVMDYSTKFAQAMRRDGQTFTGVNSDYTPGMHEIRIVPNRKKAEEVGVPMNSLAYSINALVGGVRVGRFTSQGKRYDVRLRLLQSQRGSPDDIKTFYIRADNGMLVPISDVVDLQEISTLPIINRYNHRRKVEITANTAPGVSQGDAVKRTDEIAGSIFPADSEYRIVQVGNAEAMRSTFNSMAFALGLGIVIAYMVLGVQFNSFIHPFTVLLAMPFAITGALATLWWFGDTLNLMSMIGLVLLMGLVKKNSIILVDYINQLRATGLNLEEAVRRACPVRLRPILMTSLATIAGALPLALGYGPGAETRAPLARGVIGGIIVSTLVTLIVVPVFYVLFDHATSIARKVSHFFFGERHHPAAAGSSAELEPSELRPSELQPSGRRHEELVPSAASAVQAAPS